MDLIVLAADNTIRASMETLLLKHDRLGIRPIEFEAYSHPHRDPGVFSTAQDFLRQFLKSHDFAIAIFDREGCGSDLVAGAIRKTVQQKLDANGWKNRSSVIVLDPEIEAWVWSPSQNVANALGWRDFRTLKRWLVSQQFLAEEQTKPPKPKEAMEAALKQAKIPRSTAIYVKIAAKIDFENCVDETFLEFTNTLRGWFPPAPA